MERVLERLEQAVWGWPLLGLLLGSGLWLLLRLRLRPLRELPLAMRLLFRRRGDRKGVSALGALCTSLSATVGTGNLVGVAAALSMGGPGALFWMELSALTGLSLKYAEGVLAVRFRKIGRDGNPWGGPFVYIAEGLGPGYRLLAAAFACFGAFAGLCGVGTFVQVGSVTACLSALLSGTEAGGLVLRLPWGGTASALGAAAGLLLAVLAALVIFRGMDGVSRLSLRIVPLMGGLYVLLCLWVLLRHADQVPELLLRVLRSAFSARSAGAGLLGTMTAGVSRGIFSNEAGLGTAPIAAASARGVSPREQGLISMTATVFDTFLICTLTGLVILATGCEGGGVSGTLLAFSRGLPLPPALSGWLIFTVLTLFAFTTVVGWSCYGTACLDHLSGGNPGLRKLYLILYAATAALAPLFSARSVWMAANLCSALMAVPNVIGLLLLSGAVAESSREPLDFSPNLRYNTKKNRTEKEGASHAAKTDGDRPGGRRRHPLRPGRGGLRHGKNGPPGPGDEIRSAGPGAPAGTPAGSAPGGRLSR